ncbi:MAG TPA: DUF1499 domain-containing protein [Burkholderiales bacterium]|nr:DUF1499 domain-containing protein [Burkholderiales bacterium]
MQASSKDNTGWRFAVIGLTLAVLCVLAAMASGLGYRAGFWHFRTGFLVLRSAAFAALAAGVIALLGIILSRGARRALIAGAIGVVIALAFVYVPWQWKRTLDALPYIHDITTDTDNPPAFVAAEKLRKEGDHPVAYDGPEVAAQQKQAYPDIAPLITPASKDKVFAAAQRVIENMGMKLTGADLASGRLEATDTSFWYGFTDDFVVRITEAAQGTRVDVRSKSRVGRSDLGQNAKRVRAFLAKLRHDLQ